MSREQWQSALRELYRRSVKDESFRQRCIADPKAALSEVTDLLPPEGLNLRFHDAEPGVASFVLPNRLPEGQDLNDSELDDLAYFTAPTTTDPRTCKTCGWA